MMTAREFVDASGTLPGTLSEFGENFDEALRLRNCIGVVANAPEGTKLLEWFTRGTLGWAIEGRDAWQSAVPEYRFGICSLLPIGSNTASQDPVEADRGRRGPH